MKKHFLFFVAAIYFAPSLMKAQVIEWQNTIGGVDIDYLVCTEETVDGGYILGGHSESNISGDKSETCHGDFDYWIVKTDSSGNIIWQNTIGGDGDDQLHSIHQTSDGGYIIGGYSESNFSGDKTEANLGYADYWIIKTDSLGIIQWQNTIGGSGMDVLLEIDQTSDGGYIIGGHSNSNISPDKTENSIGSFDYWIIKTDPSGNIQWQNTIGGNGIESLFAIEQTSDGSYILGGSSTSNISGDKTENNIGSYDYWIVKIDFLGSILWQNTIGGNSIDDLRSINETADGGYILGGSSMSGISGDKTEYNFGSFDYWIVKTDSMGMIQWQHTIGGNDDDRLYSIFQISNESYFIGGSSRSSISGNKTENCIGIKDYWIVKTDSLGVIQWQNTIGGNDYDELISTSRTSDSGYILGGSSNSDISGDKSEDCHGELDYWIVKIFDLQTVVSEVTEISESLLIYPNPANSTLFIDGGKVSNSDSRIIISDVAGRTIFMKPITSTSTKYSIDISTFSQGIYFVQLEGFNKISRGRFMKD